MSLFKRSWLNLLRSPGRTLTVIAILAVSLGLALTMFEVHGATASQLGNVGGLIGTDITVRPAGSSGFGTDSGTLAQTDVDKLGNLPHVVSVQSTTSTSYSGDALTAAVPTNLPQATSVSGQPLPTGAFNFRMSIRVEGLDPSDTNPTLMGGGTITMVSGSYFTADDADSNVMVVGQSLAEANDLQIGSQVDIEGTQVEVIGIYSSGQLFGDNMILMPNSTVQRLYNLDGVTSVTVQADDVSNVDAVVSEIRTIFDSNTADIVTAQDEYNRIGSSISNAAGSSQTGMVVAFIVAAAVILLAVVLVVRQRVREIGIMKAIGASNWRIGFQFGFETLLISLAAAVAGTALTFVFAQKVADLFASGGPATPGGGFGRAFGGTFSGTFAGIHVAISPEIFLIAFAVALALAMVASIIPVWYIARVKPAEVLRNE